MAYFPFFVDLEGKRCLIIGGGEIAYRKIRILIEFGVFIHVVALEFCESLKHLKADHHLTDHLRMDKREYNESDFEDVFFVIAATDDVAINHKVAQICKNKHILINVVDQKDDCSFYFPSLIKKGEIVTGVSSGGNSPVLAKNIRKKIEEIIPDYYSDINKQMGEIREYVKKQLKTQNKRKKCLEELFKLSDKRKRKLTNQEIVAIIQKYK